jgi:hypothetical protein
LSSYFIIRRLPPRDSTKQEGMNAYRQLWKVSPTAILVTLDDLRNLKEQGQVLPIQSALIVVNPTAVR